MRARSGGGSCVVSGKAWERRVNEESRDTSTDLIRIVGGTNVDRLQQVEAEYTVGKELCGVAAVGYLMQRLRLFGVRKNGYLQKAGTGGEKERDQFG